MSATLEATTSPAAAGEVRQRSGRRRLHRRALALRWVTVAVAVALWQLAMAGSTSSYFAAPSRIASVGVPYLGGSDALTGLLLTAREFLIAFAIAAVAGIVIGVLLGRSPRFAAVGGDAAYLLYSLPQVPFYPLFILWLGTGTKSEIAFGISHGVMPVILTSIAAARRTDHSLVTAARSMGATHTAVLRHVVLPGMVPDLITALRVGASLSLVGVLVGQVLVSIDGVGGLIGQLSGSLQAAQLDAVVLAVCAAAVVLNVALRLLESRLTRWRP